MALLLMASSGRAQDDAPLTTADVVRFLKAGIGERTILAEVRDRRFGEPLTLEREAALRAAGASETLVVAVRSAAPAEGAASPGSTAGGPAGASPPSLLPPGKVPPGTASSDLTFAARTRTVRVPVSVLDQAGQPVMDLASADFRVSEDGKRQQVTLFSGERRPLRVALALDVSGSMDHKIRETEKALEHFIALLEPEDEILVITFSDRVQVVQDFTSDRSRLARVLQYLEPVGGTALYDAAFEAVRRVSVGPAESKAVVLVTDGVDTASLTSFASLRELARRTEVPIFSIGLAGLKRITDLSQPGGGGGSHRWPGGGGRGAWPGGGGRGSWPGTGGHGGPGGGPPRGMAKPEGFDDRPLLELADDTGGRAEILKELHYTPGSDGPGDRQLQDAVERIAMTLRYRYLLGYEPPEGKKGWRAIRVEVERPASTARAKKGYYGGG
jgi:VWFA-related protein